MKKVNPPPAPVGFYPPMFNQMPIQPVPPMPAMYPPFAGRQMGGFVGYPPQTTQQ